MKKTILVIFILVCLGLIIGLGIKLSLNCIKPFTFGEKCKAVENDAQIIGGQTDEHGCLSAAGYSWCPSTEKCQKMWEEYCAEFKAQFKITDFDSCVKAGNPIMESYPEKCQAGNEVFVNEKNAVSQPIILENFVANQEISSPLTIKGQALGNWFFEASFPVILTDWDGLIIAEGIATAQSDWMVEGHVPFEVTLTFEKPTYKNNGSLIFRKDNPSGLPENDDYLELPIIFQ